MLIHEDYDHPYVIIGSGEDEALKDLVVKIEEFLYGKDYPNYIGVSVRIFVGHNDTIGIKLDVWESLSEKQKQFIHGMVYSLT